MRTRRLVASDCAVVPALQPLFDARQ